MKLVATSFAALGLMAAPLVAQEAAAPAPVVKTAGVAQQAQVGQATLLGLPPLVIGVGVTAVVFGAAAAISNAGDDDNATPGTR